MMMCLHPCSGMAVASASLVHTLQRLSLPLQCSALACTCEPIDVHQLAQRSCSTAARGCAALVCNWLALYSCAINAKQCNAMQCNAMQCNAMQCNAMQCNAMQCNAMQCNAVACW